MLSSGPQCPGFGRLGSRPLRPAFQDRLWDVAAATMVVLASAEKPQGTPVQKAGVVPAPSGRPAVFWAARETLALFLLQGLPEKPAPSGEAAHPTDTTRGEEEVEEKPYPDGKVGAPAPGSQPHPRALISMAWG